MGLHPPDSGSPPTLLAPAQPLRRRSPTPPTTTITRAPSNPRKPRNSRQHGSFGEVLSERPPISATLPLAESATLLPNEPAPISPLPVSCVPCWVHVAPERVKTHTAPTRPFSSGAPTSAVLPSEDSATLWPNSPSSGLTLLPVSLTAALDVNWISDGSAVAAEMWAPMMAAATSKDAPTVTGLIWQGLLSASRQGVARRTSAVRH